jgi:hypothetical protein
VRLLQTSIAALKRPLMEAGMGTRRMIGSALGASFAIALGFSPLANATEVEGYSFTSAAQEVTQLFWLAETASACGWAAPDEATKFKLFALRFLSAHLSEPNQRALLSLVTEPKYEDQLRRAAVEGAQSNCDSRRWQIGWSSYKAAADANENTF